MSYVAVLALADRIAGDSLVRSIESAPRHDALKLVGRCAVALVTARGLPARSILREQPEIWPAIVEIAAEL